MKHSYKATLFACYAGYITQAIVNNLTPLLFLIFRNEFGISYEMIGRLIVFNFGTQLVVDYLAIHFVDQVGYRAAAVAAHVLCGIGLILLGVLPNLMEHSYIGIVIAVIVYAIGGGLIEVLVSPIVNSLPGDAKASAMSLLHSFYCWGHVAVVVISTLILKIIGSSHWFILPVLWSILPLVNAVCFLQVPLVRVEEETEKIPLRKLLSTKMFVVILFMMAAGAASEQAMSQWSSLFAEIGLGVPKVLGDLLGPCFFAGMMGLSRLIYGIKGEELPLKKAMIGSAVLCICSYMLSALSPFPVLAFLGCGLCGFSVGLMWPGTFSLAAEQFPSGSTAMFGMMALLGDAGCALGPWAAGAVSDLVKRLSLPLNTSVAGFTADQLGLKCGLFISALFPLLLFICTARLKIKNKEEVSYEKN